MILDGVFERLIDRLGIVAAAVGILLCESGYRFAYIGGELIGAYDVGVAVVAVEVDREADGYALLEAVLYLCDDVVQLRLDILYLLMYFPVGVIINLDVPKLTFSSFKALYQE